jgi:hypothetical protein
LTGPQHRQREHDDAQVAFILQLLSINEKFGIDDVTAKCVPNLTHGFADCIKECATRVLHKVPPVRDLLGIRQTFGDGFTVATAAIAGDN